MSSIEERTPPIPVIDTVRAGARIVLRHPGQTLLPVGAIHLPLAIVLAAVTMFASLTILKDEPLDPFESEARRTLFVFLAVTGAQILFSLVARAGAIKAAAAAAKGEVVSVSQALDPAFSRMGGLIGLTFIVFALALPIIIPFVGLVIVGYIGLRVALSFEVFMLEGAPPLNAVRRSWELTGGRMLRLIGVLAVSSLALLGPGILLSLLGLAVTGSRTQQVILGAGYTVAQGVLIIPVVAFTSAVTAVFYLQATGNLDVRRDV